MQAYNAVMRGDTPEHIPLITMPKDGLSGLLASLEEDKRLEQEVLAAVARDADFNSVFTTGMRNTLVEELKPLIGQMGFRPSFISTMTACVYAEAMGNEVAHWFPSPAWVYNFMREELGCSFRRGTTSRPNHETIAETDALHLRNLQRIAILRADGWEDWQFMTNDQFGAHLFPQHRGVWAQKGTVDVFLENMEEKRQYTANICANGAGEVRLFLPVRYFGLVPFLRCCCRLLEST